MSGTSDHREALALSSHHPEGAFVFEAFGDHFTVAVLEDVQRQHSSGKEHEIQRKEWNFHNCSHYARLGDALNRFRSFSFDRLRFFLKVIYGPGKRSVYNAESKWGVHFDLTFQIVQHLLHLALRM